MSFNRRALLLGLASCFLAFGFSANARGALPDNWMSEIFARVRKARKMERFQVSDIAAAIQSHPKGKELAQKPNFRQAIEAGVKAATKQQKEIDATPMYVGPTAAQAGALETCDQLGIDYPDPEAP